MPATLHPSLPVLLIDDEEIMLKSFKRALSFGGINNVVLSQDSRNVMDVLAKQKIGVILLDLLMPHLSGEELLSLISRDYPEIPIIIITGVREVETAVQCMRANAYDYLVKPVDEDRLLNAVHRAIEYREMKEEIRFLKRGFFPDQLENPDYFKNIITQNKEMLSIFHYIEAVAPSSQPVLISGETGSGKESIAEAIHKCSKRQGDLIKISIAGLDDTVFSDTLFGHTKGAFTGADSPRKGLVEKAYNGSLFLDEIGDLDFKSQIKLLRLIQEKEFFPLGSDEPKRSHARIVVATNKNLDELVKKNQFRKDLFYRLNSHKITIPPLRERLDDLLILVDHFVDLAAEEFDKGEIEIPRQLPALLAAFEFPGNIRELKAMIFDAVARSQSGTLNLELFSRHIKSNRQEGGFSSNSMATTSGGHFASLYKLPTVKQATEMLISEALKRANGNKTIAAQLLGITRQTIVKYTKQNEE